MKKYVIGFILLIIVIITVVLLTNKTFFKYLYLDKVVIPKYSYFISESKLSLVNKDDCCDTEIELLSFRSKNNLEAFRNNNIFNLESCYDEGYFYDSKYNVTYSVYEIESNMLFNKIKIRFSNINMCENEFVLSDSWLDDLKESTITNYNFNYEVLIEKLENSTRLESNEIIQFDDTYQVSYLSDKTGYSTYFTVYDKEILGVILLDANDAKKYAIYDINQDVRSFLESLKQYN